MNSLFFLVQLESVFTTLTTELLIQNCTSAFFNSRMPDRVRDKTEGTVFPNANPRLANNIYKTAFPTDLIVSQLFFIFNWPLKGTFHFIKFPLIRVRDVQRPAELTVSSR